jgi:DeoR family suf operon transcriptional repressor
MRAIILRTAMQETRTQILQILQRDGGATVAHMARQLNLSIGTLRHHVSILERDGLLTREKVRQRIGRPQHHFRLSAKGKESFPKRYDSLSCELVAQIKATFGAKGLTALLDRMSQEALEKYDLSNMGRSVSERADFLIGILEQEGFVANWEQQDDKLQITQHTCPYHAVTKEHPEICQYDTKLISIVLDAPVKRTSCMSCGDRACTFEAVIKSPQDL